MSPLYLNPKKKPERAVCFMFAFLVSCIGLFSHPYFCVVCTVDTLHIYWFVPCLAMFGVMLLWSIGFLFLVVIGTCIYKDCKGKIKENRKARHAYIQKQIE